MAVVRAMQDNFEVILKIWKCVWSKMAIFFFFLVPVAPSGAQDIHEAPPTGPVGCLSFYFIPRFACFSSFLQAFLGRPHLRAPWRFQSSAVFSMAPVGFLTNSIFFSLSQHEPAVDLWLSRGLQLR
jgi:hypothetical protein